MIYTLTPEQKETVRAGLLTALERYDLLCDGTMGPHEDYMQCDICIEADAVQAALSLIETLEGAQ